jgi:hypothetical protein
MADFLKTTKVDRQNTLHPALEVGYPEMQRGLKLPQKCLFGVKHQHSGKLPSWTENKSSTFKIAGQLAAQYCLKIKPQRFMPAHSAIVSAPPSIVREFKNFQYLGYT